MSRLAPSVLPVTTTEIAAPPLVTRALLLRFVSVVGSSIGFFLPLSVVPMFAEEAGAAGGAALATVALLLSTVACELVTPRLIGLVGYRWSLALGLTLLGLPTIALTVSASTWVIVAASVVRGAGFAICVVAGGAVTATLIPPQRRGEGLALVGVVGGVPSLIALPAGVWAAAQWGYGPVFMATTVATLLALPSVLGLPGRTGPVESAHGVVAGLRNPLLARPAAVFAVAAVGVGVLVTFLPLAMIDQPAWVAAAALLAQSGAATAVRLVAGRLGDRHGPARLLGPGLVLSACGMATLALGGTPAVVVGGALVFGIGFGVLQNATLTLMYARGPAGSEGAVSAIWNAAYDLGMAAGALGAGLVVAAAGYPAAFALTAVVMVPALLLVRRGPAPAVASRT